MQYRLTCQIGEARGRSWTLRGGPLSIGRGVHCDVVLRDKAASRDHCVVREEDGRLLVLDAQSANGTFVNDEPVGRCELKPGDELRIGQTSFLVGIGDASDELESDAGYSDSIFLSETESILLKDHIDASAFEGKPDSIVDLASISSLGRELSHARTRDDITRSLTRRLRRHVNPLAIHLIDVMAEPPAEQLLFVRRGHKAAPETTRSQVANRVARGDDEGGGIIEPIPRTPDPVWLAVTPLKVGGNVVGVLSLELGQETAYTPERVLDFLLALGMTVGPFFHAIDRLETLRADNKRLSTSRSGEPIFVGESASVLHLKEQVRLAAPTDLGALVLGETGTGKELVAELLHKQSPRSRNKFVAVNCAAIPPELFTSELFGHVKGGFTGAEGPRTGFVELAAGGTLFLDEFTELSLQHQAALLRFLESKTFYPVGSGEERYSDARVIAATNRDPQALIREGTLREDLYHRVAAMHLSVPPLRERPEDIPLLAEHFFNQALRNARRPLLGLTREAIQCLTEHPWPGNARELRNVVERCVAFATEESITREQVEHHLPAAGEPLPNFGSTSHTLEEVERMYIERVYESCDRNVVHAAEVLGVGKTTLYEKLAKYGIRTKRPVKN